MIGVVIERNMFSALRVFWLLPNGPTISIKLMEWKVGGGKRLGQNGSGKSTTSWCMGRVLEPDDETSFNDLIATKVN
jgi:energy-coupling factor transporter ATP-binding protein EcfA2